jgi:hypothetical protein
MYGLRWALEALLPPTLRGLMYLRLLDRLGRPDSKIAASGGRSAWKGDNRQTGRSLSLLEVPDAVLGTRWQKNCGASVFECAPAEWKVTDVRVVSKFHGLGGIAIDLRCRCHKGDGVIWWCVRDDTSGPTWYISSGRRYPKDERRSAIRSTKIRQVLDEISWYKQYDKIKRMALNPDKSIFFLENIHETLRFM